MILASVSVLAHYWLTIRAKVDLRLIELIIEPDSVIIIFLTGQILAERQSNTITVVVLYFLTQAKLAWSDF